MNSLVYDHTRNWLFSFRTQTSSSVSLGSAVGWELTFIGGVGAANLRERADDREAGDVGGVGILVLAPLVLVPMALYFKNNKAKLEIGLGRGKKTVDKRQDIAKPDADREARRELATRSRR